MSHFLTVYFPSYISTSFPTHTHTHRGTVSVHSLKASLSTVNFYQESLTLQQLQALKVGPNSSPWFIASFPRTRAWERGYMVQYSSARLTTIQQSSFNRDILVTRIHVGKNCLSLSVLSMLTSWKLQSLEHLELCAPVECSCLPHRQLPHLVDTTSSGQGQSSLILTARRQKREIMCLPSSVQ